MPLITLKEYAERNGKSRYTALQRLKRGRIQTAERIGYQWFVDEDEPWEDARIKTGVYTVQKGDLPNKHSNE